MGKTRTYEKTCQQILTIMLCTQQNLNVRKEAAWTHKKAEKREEEKLTVTKLTENSI